MKLHAVFAAIRGKSAQPRHFWALALAFLLCGVFYWLGTANPSIAKTANIKAEKAAQIICEDKLPQASLSEPSFELFKRDVLCEKPQEKEPEPEIIEEPEDPEVVQLRKDLEPILTGTPMEQMIEPIAHQDRTVAAFLVGVAFKESKFGVHSPSKNGSDCYNYWGYKGKTNPVMGGYSCFSSPEQAVETVGTRLEKLAIQNKRATPAQMTVWKCGSSCATHSPQSVSKWISDVSLYFYKIEA